MKISEQIFPRPVLLVCTVDGKGKENVMPASFSMPVSFNPKFLAVSISPNRYTFVCLKETGEFTANVATAGLFEQVKYCGSVSGRDVDKLSCSGLRREPSVKVRPPTLADCPISLECVVEDMREFGDHHIVVGRVVHEHIRRRNFVPLLHHTGERYMVPKEL